jgi:fructokinase
LSEGVIVVGGEALVDLVLGEDPLGGAGGALAWHPGGGPYNVARTIARLGQSVAYLGRLSTDRFGARLRRELEADGVRLEAVVTTDAPTTVALAEVDAAGAARYRFYVTGTSAPGLTPEAATAALPARVAAFYAGTLGLVFEPMASALEALVGRMGGDTLVAVDPNCRPAAIDDPVTYRARLDRMLARADVVKASEDDLAWIDPGAAPVDAARALLAHEHAAGPPGGVALVTLGAAGALVVTAADVTEVPSPPVEVADTIGAGDAFMGAFLARWRARGLGRADLAHRDDVVEAAAFACRVAAITCSRAGADPPRASELR